ncbi:hypothetical protein [Shewanella marina]|uniref:hypothetical protein n=1 Tax=Shewanella marina TaxID=487319 RepID=UPI000472B5CC|nr:hypothetical protein [Shewanella marina]
MCIVTYAKQHAAQQAQQHDLTLNWIRTSVWFLCVIIAGALFFSQLVPLFVVTLVLLLGIFGLLWEVDRAEKLQLQKMKNSSY